MKFLVFNDPHLASKGPVSRTDDYTEALFRKLDQIRRLAIHLKVKGVLCTGDWFDRNSRVTWNIIDRLLEWAWDLKRNDILVLSIPGNHDLQFDRYDLLSHQPLGVVFRSGLIRDVSFSPYTFDDGNESVDVVGVPWPAANDLATFHSVAKTVHNPAIVLAHCFASAEGGSYYSSTYHRYSDLPGDPVVCYCFGHDHSDRSVSVDDRGIHYCAFGALSRGSIARENIDRAVKCVLIDTGSALRGPVKVTQVKLEVTPASQCFDLVLKAQKDRESDHIEQFVTQLSHDLSEAGPASFRERLEKMDLPDDVRKRVMQYIAAAEQPA